MLNRNATCHGMAVTSCSSVDYYGSTATVQPHLQGTPFEGQVDVMDKLVRNSGQNLPEHDLRSIWELTPVTVCSELVTAEVQILKATISSYKCTGS